MFTLLLLLGFSGDIKKRKLKKKTKKKQKKKQQKKVGGLIKKFWPKQSLLDTPAK